MEFSIELSNKEEIRVKLVKVRGEDDRFSLTSVNGAQEYLQLIFDEAQSKFVIVGKENEVAESENRLIEKLDTLALEYIEMLQSGSEDTELEFIEDEIKHPYDAEKIRVDTKNFSLRQIFDMIEQGDIDLSPDFQRHFVWDNLRQSRLIESILLRIPLPMFYFAQDEEGRITVVDGLQRLSTIYNFMQDKFKLKGLEYLDNNNEKIFSSLDPKYARWFNMTQIFANIIDPQSPTRVKYDIFRRINTGGRPLNNQEIRNSLASRALRQRLTEMANSQEFKNATGWSVKDTRMEAQEFALRFMAFSEYYSEDKEFKNYAGNMNHALDDVTDKFSKYANDQLDKFMVKFKNAMLNASHLFGKHSFRKILMHHLEPNQRRQLVNKALFVSWAVLLSEYSHDILKEKNEIACFQLPLAEKITNDSEFFKAISWGTNGRWNLKVAFEKAQELITEHLNY